MLSRCMRLYTSHSKDSTARTNKFAGVSGSLRRFTATREFIQSIFQTCVFHLGICQKATASLGALKKKKEYSGAKLPRGGKKGEQTGRKILGAFINIAIVQASKTVFFICCLRYRLQAGTNLRVYFRARVRFCATLFPREISAIFIFNSSKSTAFS